MFHQVELGSSEDDLDESPTHGNGEAAMGPSRASSLIRSAQFPAATPKLSPPSSSAAFASGNADSASVVTEHVARTSTFGSAHQARLDLGEICCLGGVNHDVPRCVMNRVPYLAIVFGVTHGDIEWFEWPYDGHAAYLYATCVRTSKVMELPLPFFAARIGFCQHMHTIWQDVIIASCQHMRTGSRGVRTWAVLVAQVSLGRAEAGLSDLVVAHVVKLRDHGQHGDYGFFTLLGHKIREHGVRVVGFSSPFRESLRVCVGQFVQSLLLCGDPVHVPIHNDDWTQVFLVLGPCRGFRGKVSSVVTEFAQPLGVLCRDNGLPVLPPIHCKLMSRMLISLWIKGAPRRSEQGLRYQVSLAKSRHMLREERREQVTQDSQEHDRHDGRRPARRPRRSF